MTPVTEMPRSARRLTRVWALWRILSRLISSCGKAPHTMSASRSGGRLNASVAGMPSSRSYRKMAAVTSVPVMCS